MLSSREYAWHNMIKAGAWWNRTQMIRYDVNIYNIIIIIIKLEI